MAQVFRAEGFGVGGMSPDNSDPFMALSRVGLGAALQWAWGHGTLVVLAGLLGSR